MEICKKSISTNLFFLLFIFTVFPAYSQNDTQTDNELILNETLTADQVSDPDTEKTLFQKTLSTDISTADFYELAAWCRYLGLDEKGGKKDLQKRLYSYYEQEEKALEEGQEEKNTLMIESAERTEYFNIEKIDENYIKISGNVVVTMEDKKKETTHVIKTDRIILNQENNLITAFGNVNYTRSGKEGSEIFRGEKLSFNITNWEGIFIEGTSEKKKEQDGKDLTFRYSGKRIYRSENDLIILDKAEITSSKPDDPYYNIKAKRIWVLAPGEWGVKNAVLYVGHVPVFYFPFFFHPGDKLVFNPAFGMKIPHGFFLQTTTYLLGEPDTNQNLSFLALTEEDAKYETELNGIFLKKTEKKEVVSEDENYVKLMFDAYSRLGFFAGIEGKTDISDFYAGLGRSRNIYISPGNKYSPYYENEDGEFKSSWNDANFLKYDIPFRFGAKLDMKNKYRDFQYSLYLDLYSDPYFLRDFNERAEKTDWSKVLGLEEDEEPDTDIDTGILDRLWWYFHGSWNISDDYFGGLITDINFSKIDFSLNWKNKKQPDTGFSGIDPGLDGYIPFFARTDYFFPEQYFYYPEYYKFPDISFTIKGDIFSASYDSFYKNKDFEKPDDPGGAELLKPWLENVSDSPAAVAVEYNYDAMPRILEYEKMKDEAVKLYKKRKFFQHGMSYSISPSISVTETMDYSEWETPKEVTFEQAYTAMRLYGNANVTYDADLYEDFSSFTNNIVLTEDYRIHYNRSGSIEDAVWDSYLLQDYKASYLKIENKSLFTVYPLLKYDMYNQSFASYRINTIIAKKEFDYLDNSDNPVYKDSFFQFDKEYFTEHKADFNLKYLANWNQIQHFRIITVLPPLLQEIENEDLIRTGPLTSTLNFKAYEKSEDNWEYGDFTWKEKLSYDNNTYIEQITIYDGENDEWDSWESIGRISFFYDEVFFRQSYKYGYPESSPLELSSQLNLWFFETKYKAERKYPMEYQQGFGWIEGENQEFVPSEFSATIDFTRYFMPVWKNRVRYKTKILTSWVMDLQEFTENSLVFNFGFDMKVHEFLDLSFNSKSENNSTYRYIPSYAKQLGEETVNPFSDLVKSFNFFDGGEQRYESFFKLKEVDVKAVHHLGDWDLTLQYSGAPNLYQPSSGVPEWRWDSKMTIMMQWNPIKEIKTEIKINNNELSL
jgi:lipopolysaccharide assembly outer membrane protein LptD (OstA)